jgi:uncharacterized protein YecE (DUF72 family)
LGLIRIGCAGWNVHRAAAEHFITEGSHLERYSQVLNCCEINSSFYRPHKNQTWERWANSVTADFRFSVKAPRTITHESRLQCDANLLSDFLQQISHLGGKLGPVLFQLPPSLEFEDVTARNFLALLRENYMGAVVWEPRHASWFTTRANRLLKDYQIARVAADPPCVRAATRPGGATDLVYFRLHGSPRMYYSSYSDEFLGTVASDFQNLPARTSIWCIFDNTASGSALENAVHLSAKLNKDFRLCGSGAPPRSTGRSPSPHATVD